MIFKYAYEHGIEDPKVITDTMRIMLKDRRFRFEGDGKVVGRLVRILELDGVFYLHIRIVD